MASSINVKIAPLPRGEYSSSATYAKLDVVSYNGSSYMAIKAVPTGTIPTNTTYWQLLAEAPSISDGSITTDKIADGAISEDKLDDDVLDIIKGAYPSDTASGNIASFPDGAEMPVEELKVNLEPIQDLNGYDSPWVGGAGKNLLNPTGTTQTINGVTFTVNADGSVNVTGTATANANFVYSVTTFGSALTGDYYLNGNPTGASSTTYRMRIRQYANSTWGAYSYDNNTTDYSFALASAEKVEVHILVVSGYAISGTLTFKPMLRLATESDASYAPYENICPITGHTETNVVRTGKNFLPTLISASTTKNGVTATLNSDGSVTLNGTATAGGYIRYPSSGKAFLNNKQGKYVTLSGCPSGGSTTQYRLCAYLYLNGTYTNRVIADYGSGASTNQPFDEYYAQIQYYNGVTYNNLTFKPQFEFGSSASDYEPYNGDTYNIPLNQTVYGGTLDVSTGVLTVTKGYKSFNGSENWQRTSGSSGVYRYNVNGTLTGSKRPASNSTNANLLSNMYESKTANQTYTGVQGISQQANLDDMYVYDSTYSALTLDDWKAHLASNNLQVIYELATPQTYQLTPTQVTTLLGYNNIWADNGTVEVKYLADTSLYIQKLTGSTEDDMVANQNISANQYFMVGNELFYSTTAIANGASIIVGTNCTKTNLAEALNALNS